MAHKKKSTRKKHEYSLLDLLLGHTNKRKKAHHTHSKKKTAKKATARKTTKKAVKAKGKGAYGRNPYR
ncbi:hypothetical protein HYX58_00610 [Candidatus Dependentiae bacterium]|nr:hypothetical protein [Candidatus Dependentiae bacterium]